MAISTVTLHPRAIARHGTIGGAYWRTFDFNKVKDRKSATKILGRDIEKLYDASEQFGHLPNGFWATGLFDRQGKRQDVAPNNVAGDTGSKSTDLQIHVNVSCLRCHTNGGLKDIDAWVRNLLIPPLELRSPDEEKAIELRNQYATNLDASLDDDRAVFERAVKEVTGWKSKEYSAAYAEYWEQYEDAKIGIKEAARDLGVSEKRFRDALSARVKAGFGETEMSSFLLPNPRLNRITIRVWEDNYADAHLILRGYN